MYMLKSNGGSGTAKNCQFNNFIGHSNAYTLDLNAFWSSEKVQTGSGVQYSNISSDGWKGTCADGTRRAPMNVVCPADVPCIEISISNSEVWTDSGSFVLWRCENSFGGGGCLNSGAAQAYTAVSTIKAAPSDYSIPKMPNDLTALSLTEEIPIPIPIVPTTFFPGATPARMLLGNR